MEGVTIEDAISISCETPLIRKSEIVSLDDAIDRILAIDIYSKVNDIDVLLNYIQNALLTM